MTEATAESNVTAETLRRARAHIERGELDGAGSLLRSLLDAGFGDDDELDARYLLAVVERLGGRHDAALDILDEVLRAHPDVGRAQEERGHVHLARDEPERALRAFAEAVRLNPALHGSWQAIATLHERAGRAREAAQARREVEFLRRLPPELLAVHNLIHENKLYRAERLCRAFLRKHKHHIEAMRLLADIATRLKIYDDAEFLLESCVEFAPDYTRARVDYVNVLIRKTRFQKAHEQASILVEKEPENPSFLSSLATTCVGLGRFDEGIALYARVLERDPAQPKLQLLLGHAQKTVGRLDDAIAAYRRAYEIRPDFGDAYWSLANTKTYRFSDDEIERIVEQINAEDVAADDRIHLCFAAGKALEDREAFDRAFHYYELGNLLKRRQMRYDPDETERRVDRQIAVCTPELFEARRGVGCEARDPIFIVGLPRAGSTLLEQILASHSMVDGTMELHNILALAQRLRGRMAEKESRYPEILRDLDASYFRRFGEAFLEETRVYRGGAPLFIDKMPNNFFHIGLIRLILPNAKVIDARRDPMACSFSVFKQLFGEGHEFSYDLHDIGRYYRDYVRLMDHFDEVLPGFVLRVMHEDVVADLEGQVRRILEFCGLPFEERCLEFYKTERSVRTPSSEQVKQPIYREATEQWRHFAAHLEPLRDALGPSILARYPSGAEVL